MKKFWSKVNKTDDCWLWTAYLHYTGYGRFRFREKIDGAHRVAYILVKGEIPKGLWIDHLCRNRACVNPDHLEAVSPQENILRGIGIAAINAKKTHCPQGHLYAENRLCKECKNRSYKKHYYRNQEKMLARKRVKYWEDKNWRG